MGSKLNRDDSTEMDRRQKEGSSPDWGKPSPRTSARMSRVRSSDTTPELRVRSALHRLGYRFRLHRRDLPGTPDVVLPKYRTVIFVHGCYWHRHPGCRRASTPRTNSKKWEQKFERNVTRDQSNAEALERLGWRVLVVWECETKGQESLEAKLQALLSS